MKITLRHRNQGGKTSLYLDYSHNGKRKAEYLKLYLEPNAKTKEVRDQNKKTLQLAETIRAQRQIEMQNGIYGFSDNSKMKGSFIAYVELLTRKRSESLGNYGNWSSMLKHLKVFADSKVTFAEVDRKFVQDFREFLDRDAIARGNQGLSQNSKASYFNKFRAALKQAVKDGLILINPAESVNSFKQDEPMREFLTQEELDAAAKAECDIPQLKTAFLFSCLTGLRWSDIEKFTWSQLQSTSDRKGGEEMRYFIRFRQQKTKGVETHPIAQQAVGLLGDRKAPEERVFKGLKYSSWHNLKLQQWMMRAGISKTITFHCARHTYATLLLTEGEGIYTVSKLLGHRELKTTQIYANIIDEKKSGAANKIRINF